MRKSTIVGAVASIVVAGCGSLDKDHRHLMASAATKRPGIPDCGSPSPTVVRCEADSRDKKCPTINITVDANNNISVTPNVLMVRRHRDQNGKFHPARIIWHLDESSGAEFAKDNNDGISVTNDHSDTQFNDNYITEKNDNDQKPNKGKAFHSRLKNSEGGKYRYVVQVRKGGRTLTCDPTINNESAD